MAAGDRAMQTGVAQKRSVKPAHVHVFKSTMVAGLFVPQHRNRDRAALKFQDPDWRGLAQIVSSLSNAECIGAIRRISLAKQLALLELPNTARAVAFPLTPPVPQELFELEGATGGGVRSGRRERVLEGRWRAEVLAVEGGLRQPVSYRFSASYPEDALQEIIALARRPADEREVGLREFIEKRKWPERPTLSASEQADERHSEAAIQTRAGSELQLQLEWV